MIVLQAIGGSTNGLIHLTAMAGRAGVKLDLDAFDRLGREIPVLLNLKPSGAHYMEHFHHAGGVPALMRELSPFSIWMPRASPAARSAMRSPRRKWCRGRM